MHLHYYFTIRSYQHSQEGKGLAAYINDGLKIVLVIKPEFRSKILDLLSNSGLFPLDHVGLARNIKMQFIALVSLPQGECSTDPESRILGLIPDFDDEGFVLSR